MNKVTLRGIGPNTLHDDRTLLIIDIEYNGEVYPWEFRVPPSITSNWDDYLQQHSDEIYQDLQNKLDQWQTLDPKTKEVPGILGRPPEVVDIKKEEIVKPTYPDYYVQRAMEYPPLKEQLGAIFKGGIDLEDMKDRINEVKTKHPKPL